MMNDNEVSLKPMYSVDDNLMTVFAFNSGVATICSFTEKPKKIKF